MPMPKPFSFSLKLLRSFAVFNAAFIPLFTHAEVSAVSEHGFVSEHQLVLAAPPHIAMQKFIEDVHLWWDGSHSFSGSASGFSMQAVAGGCFCESSANGVSVEHLRVVNVVPGHSITLHGGLGPLQGMAVAGSMSLQFKPHKQGSELFYKYSVGGFLPGGLQVLAQPVDQVQLGQLERLQKYIETGKPLNPE